MIMKTFYDNVRQDVFDGKLNQPQVNGMQAIINVSELINVDIQHVSQVLAHVARETGKYMSPIKETAMPYHADKNPSDATVIARLDKAWADGKLGKVKAPYWRDGWFGRGQIQISHKSNYEKLSPIVGVDLVKYPERALELETSARIAVLGMLNGSFTGKKLSDYKFPEAIFAKPDDNPRRIVNGKDGSDKEVAGYHQAFYNALAAAGYGKKISDPEPQPVTPQRTRSSIIAEIEALLAELKSLGG